MKRRIFSKLLLGAAAFAPVGAQAAKCPKAAPGLRFEIYRAADNDWRWRLLSANGRIIATSGGDGYKNKSACEHGVSLVMRSYSAAIEYPGDN